MQISKQYLINLIKEEITGTTYQKAEFVKAVGMDDAFPQLLLGIVTEILGNHKYKIMWFNKSKDTMDHGLSTIGKASKEEILSVIK